MPFLLIGKSQKRGGFWYGSGRMENYPLMLRGFLSLSFYFQVLCISSNRKDCSFIFWWFDDHTAGMHHIKGHAGVSRKRPKLIRIDFQVLVYLLDVWIKKFGPWLFAVLYAVWIYASWTTLNTELYMLSLWHLNIKVWNLDVCGLNGYGLCGELVKAVTSTLGINRLCVLLPWLAGQKSFFTACILPCCVAKLCGGNLTG